MAGRAQEKEAEERQLDDDRSDQPDQPDQSDQSDHTKPQPHRPDTVPRPIYNLVNTYKMGEGSGSRNQLPESMKLKGEENYTIWKELIQNMAVANDLRQFIHEKGRVPKYINEFDEKADTARLAVWKAWEAGDSSMMIIIKLNIKSTPMQMLAGCKTARQMWVTLQAQYEGTRAVLSYNAIESYTKIKYKDYPNLE